MIKIYYNNVWSYIEAPESGLSTCKNILTKSHMSFYKTKFKVKARATYYCFLTSHNCFLSGLLYILCRELRAKGKGFKLIDKRPDINIDIKLPSIDLRPYQQEAVDKIIKYKRGIWYVATRGGKSYTAAALIQSLNTTSLFLVNRKDLFTQTHKLFGELCNQEIGAIQGNSVNLQNVTIGMQQSVYSKLDELSEYLKSINLVIMDECFPYGTKVDTSQGKLNIGKIVSNKLNVKIYTYNFDTGTIELKPIKRYIKIPRYNNLYKIKFSGKSNFVTCTENHKFFVVENKRIQKIQAKNLEIGDFVIFKSELNRQYNCVPLLNDIQKQIVYGSLLGDGHISKNKDGYLGRFNITHFEFLLIKNSFIKNGNLSREFLGKFSGLALAIFVMDNGSFVNKNYLLHTERFNYKNNKIISKWLETKFNIITNIRKYKNKYYFLCVTRESSKLLSKLINKHVPDCLSYKLFDEDKYKYEKPYFYSNCPIGLHKVIEKNQYNKPHTNYVYNLEIKDNHNYFVNNGILVSNCHHSKSETYSQILKKCPATYRVLMSGTIPTEKTLDGWKIRAHGGKVISKINALTLVNKKLVAQPNFYFINCNSSTQDLSKYNSVDFQKWFIRAIAENGYRNQLICDLVRKNIGKKIMIIVQFVKHGDILHASIDGSKYIWGKTKNNYEIIKQFNENKFNVLIGSSILDEGITFPSIDMLILAGGGKSDRQLFQRIGRGLDPGNEKVDIFDFMDNFHKVFKKHSSIRKGYIEKEGFKVRTINEPIRIRG